MHTANTDGAPQELSQEGLANLLSDTENQKYHESLEEAVQPCRWESLWAEAYRTIKNDPEYSHLLETFEKYLRKAEHGAAEESLADASTVSEGVERLEEIQRLAKTKLEKLPEARVAFSIGGRRIVVRELVQKAIQTVTAFKSIIGGAVSAEPHAALAWAGILTILPMLENLFQQDEHAANGLNNILFILVRYQQLQETVLSNEFEAPSQTGTTRQLLTNIRTKLVSIYAQVYVYQIRFVLQYGRSKWLRNLRNIVSADDWKQMWKDIEDTSHLVDQGIQDRVGTRTLEAWKAVNDIKALTEEIKGLQMSTLETELLLRLPFAGNATFDSAEVFKAETPCLEGTQHRILSDIRDWAENPAGELIFWLHGMAGTGKTSVALTVAQALDQRKPFTRGTKTPTTAFLGATFFFKQGDQTRNSTRDFFPTLARCLANVFPDFKSLITSAINDNPDIGTKAPPQQLECLIARPLSSLDDQTFLPIRLVIVVDALDECIKRTEAEELLSMLATLKDLHQVQLRLLITSRSEKHILGSFENLSKTLHRSMLLDKIKPHTEGESIKDDITFYLSHTLEKIAETHGVAKDWIDQANINKLSKKADGLFIYAVTACRFLDAEDFHDEEARQERLDQIFQDYSETDDSDSEKDDWGVDAPQNKVDEIYLTVLSFPDHKRMPPRMREKTYEGMRMTLGFLAVLFEPVTTSSFENLLPPLPVALAQLLKKLHSIVGVPRDEKSTLDLVHLSFRDFILSKKRSKQLKFRVDETGMHKEVFNRCLEIMSSKLCRDICGLVMPGTMASEVPKSRVEENIPQHLRYACRYWVDHLAMLDSSHLREVGLMDEGKIHAFLQECFLYWLEAMSLIQEIPTTILVVNQLQTLVVNSEHPGLSSLIYDAKRFILGNRWIIDHAPLQIYASALVFSPSKIQSLFQHHMPPWITQRPVVDQDWTSELSVLEGHTDTINSVAFSSTENLVVSTSYDETARLWDYITGTERFRFDEGKRYLCAAFSPDGKSVALGSDDGLISMWLNLRRTADF
ncbi:hypothetical protein SLS63_003866 [Diaporthe eres]|uniref:NWD NACHT-NTPase N-terminal domain-containing protein n=1 Tax=Diaporthe eres TaxID=83184 RepID=A0ABR1PF72_DIAER